MTPNRDQHRSCGSDISTLRSVGDFAEGADAAGIHVRRTRYLAVLFSGAMAGLGGAVLALGAVKVFTPNMRAGRGFIVLAAIVVARRDRGSPSLLAASSAR